MGNSNLVRTAVLSRLVARMQRTHDRRRASIFVGPAGIGKSTAVEAFRAANAGDVMVTRVPGRGLTGLQALQQFLLALRARNGGGSSYMMRSMSVVQHYIALEIEKAAGEGYRDAKPDEFPKLTIVFDEAQRLTNGAIDALRDYNEPHGFCRGAFPIGLIFVGNNELSLQAGNGGASLIDEGMADRLLYRDRLTYDDVEHSDLASFARSQGVSDDGAIGAIVSTFVGPRVQRSFRRLADLIDDLRDEARGGNVTRETVRSYFALAA